jgi:beta-xylosidase
MNLSYRFGMEAPSRREAADPSVVWFKDRYFLFVSKSGGYWHSKDLKKWDFTETSEIPTEEYAPTAVAIGDTLFFLASSNELSTIYKSADPLSGRWEVAVPQLDQPVWDPAFFMDDDHRLFLYWGCSDQRPLYGVELDYSQNFAFKGQPAELLWANTTENGWEVPGDYNALINQKPWIEGPWVIKVNGKYYLQYAGPGTEFKSYADGIYVADKPLGPFQLQKHNPYVTHPEGFAAGAGHGCTFQDPYGNWWHIGTVTISQKHIFERRLALHPAFIDAEGTLYSTTKFADYPFQIPDKKINSFDEIFPGWMLLSYNKDVVVSSFVDTLPASKMTDEDIRTYWAAESGREGEFAQIDLGEVQDVYAVQINFAEHNTSLMGLQKDRFHRFVLDYSNDGKTWKQLVDRSFSSTDLTHDYFQLKEKIECRYLKLTNKEVPDGQLAISGFRVFGLGKGSPPNAVGTVTINRNPADRRSISLTWKSIPKANGYVITYGNDPNKLYHSYKVYQDSSLIINSLNSNLLYYFRLEAFNENGISKPSNMLFVE